MPDFPRAARWDVRTVLRQLAETTGICLADEAGCPGQTQRRAVPAAGAASRSNGVLDLMTLRFDLARRSRSRGFAAGTARRVLAPLGGHPISAAGSTGCCAMRPPASCGWPAGRT